MKKDGYVNNFFKPGLACAILPSISTSKVIVP
jgi:hypothetical protein